MLNVPGEKQFGYLRDESVAVFGCAAARLGLATPRRIEMLRCAAEQTALPTSTTGFATTSGMHAAAILYVLDIDKHKDVESLGSAPVT